MWLASCWQTSCASPLVCRGGRIIIPMQLVYVQSARFLLKLVKTGKLWRSSQRITLSMTHVGVGFFLKFLVGKKENSETFLYLFHDWDKKTYAWPLQQNYRCTNFLFTFLFILVLGRYLNALNYISISVTLFVSAIKISSLTGPRLKFSATEA